MWFSGGEAPSEPSLQGSDGASPSQDSHKVRPANAAEPRSKARTPDLTRSCQGPQRRGEELRSRRQGRRAGAAHPVPGIRLLCAMADLRALRETPHPAGCARRSDQTEEDPTREDSTRSIGRRRAVDRPRERGTGLRGGSRRHDPGRSDRLRFDDGSPADDVRGCEGSIPWDWPRGRSTLMGPDWSAGSLWCRCPACRALEAAPRLYHKGSISFLRHFLGRAHEPMGKRVGTCPA